MNKDFNDKNASSIEEDYNLITEHIVEKPWKKYRKTFAALKIILVAVIFGVVAGVTFSLIENHNSRIKSEAMEAETLSIDKDVMPTESSYAAEEDRQRVDFNVIVNGLKSNVDAMMSSIVAVDGMKKNVDDFIADSVSHTETAGIIIGNVARKYIILTDLNSIQKWDAIIVKLSDSCQVDASYVASDSETGIAIITIKEVDIPPEIRDNLLVSELDNSYDMSAGEWVVMMGKLHGQTKAVEYTTITSISKHSITDNITSVFNTGVPSSVGDYGFMFNASGNLIGINTSNMDDVEENTFTAFGVSDLKSLVEALSNNSGIMYMGIKGQRVTSDVSVSYQLPVGLFISEIIVDSPAYDAGLQMGDVITEIDGEGIKTFSELNAKLYSMREGQQMEVTVMRMGRESYKLTYMVTINKR